MGKKIEFHGSDLEKIAAYYQIPKEDIVLFGANVNPLGLSERAKKELTAHLDIITRYPDRNYTSLKETIAGYCKTDSSFVVVGNGSTELISLLIACRSPKKTLILGPTYSEYSRELSFTGGQISYYYLEEADDFRLNLPDLKKKLNSSIDMLILCNPNNPTSSAICTDDLEEILCLCSRHHIFVMIDETYVEFAPQDVSITAMPLIDRYDNLMIIRGVSKFFAAPGLRFGYGITSNKAFHDALIRVQNPWSLNSIGAFLGEILLTDTHYISRTRQLIRTERERMYQELSRIPAYKPYPAYANFQLVRILQKSFSSSDVFEAAIRRNMMIRDCSSFKNLNGQFFRFCHMLPDENDRLIACLTDIASGF